MTTMVVTRAAPRQGLAVRSARGPILPPAYAGVLVTAVRVRACPHSCGHESVVTTMEDAMPHAEEETFATELR
ncbi:hypothetical protein [Streptomyces sp. NPDC055036]